MPEASPARRVLSPMGAALGRGPSLVLVSLCRQCRAQARGLHPRPRRPPHHLGCLHLKLAALARHRPLVVLPRWLYRQQVQRRRRLRAQQRPSPSLSRLLLVHTPHPAIILSLLGSRANALILRQCPARILTFILHLLLHPHQRCQCTKLLTAMPCPGLRRSRWSTFCLPSRHSRASPCFSLPLPGMSCVRWLRTT